MINTNELTLGVSKPQYDMNLTGIETEFEEYWPDRNRWTDPSLHTLMSSGSFMDRMSYVVRQVGREPWLPAPLRCYILEEYLKMSKLYEHGQLELRKARELIQELSVICYRYDQFTLRSKALLQIRALDLELMDRLR